MALLPQCSQPLAATVPGSAWSRESGLLLAVLLLALVALAGPAVTQPVHYHAFADQRALVGLPHAMDVLSNLPFALFGAVGLWALAAAVRVRAVSRATAGMAGLFFVGLLVTAGVSSYYHLQPNDTGLVWDRTGMVLAFAGLLGLAALQRASERAGLALAGLVLAMGPLTVAVWAYTGNVLPWGVLQFGGMGLIVWLANLQAPTLNRADNTLASALSWGLVIALYTVAKLLELGDHQVYEWTHHLVSGHSLKHVVASLAAWPLIAALRRQTAAQSAQTIRRTQA